MTSSKRPRDNVTMSDVAREAGVSVKTVSNVASNYVHVSEGTRRRVQEAIDRLGYRMNRTAQSLRTGKTNAVGLALPTLENPYFAGLAQMVMRRAEDFGLTVLIELTDGDREKEHAVLSGPLRTMTDGLMLSTIGVPENEFQTLKVDFPLVVLGDQEFGGDVTQVTMANVEGAKAATEFLLDKGASRIALLGGHPQGASTARLRQQGYEEALKVRGLELDTELVLATREWSRESGYIAVDQALSRGVEFDAVFALNDALALGALHAASSRGLNIPGELQVIGFDNLAESAYSNPPLTTVDPRADLIARDALTILANMIHDPTLIDRKDVKVEPSSIVSRASTRPLSQAR